jgi:hypothetical protein
MGGHRTPAHRRWDITMPSTDQVINPVVLTSFNNPKITFWHNWGECVDEDFKHVPHASRIVFMPGTPLEVSYTNHPKAEWDANVAKKAAAAEAHLPPS